MHQPEPAFLPFGQFRNPPDYFPRHNQVPVLRPHPELEGTRYELLPGNPPLSLRCSATSCSKTP